MESVKNAPKSGRPKSASCPRIVEKIKRIVKSDARYIFQKTCGHDWNFKSVCIAHSAKYFEIENEKSYVGPTFAHEEAKTARKLLKRFPRYDQIKIMNVVTVYESLIHFLEPHCITKTRLFKYIENFTAKKGKFSNKKNSDIFHISAKNIACGYSLEPPRRGGSNEYPQAMFGEAVLTSIHKLCF